MNYELWVISIIKSYEGFLEILICTIEVEMIGKGEDWALKKQSFSFKLCLSSPLTINLSFDFCWNWSGTRNPAVPLPPTQQIKNYEISKSLPSTPGSRKLRTNKYVHRTTCAMAFMHTVCVQSYFYCLLYSIQMRVPVNFYLLPVTRMSSVFPSMFTF
jgi:hypothetical protein